MKSMKSHLKRIVADIKFTFEELATVLAQIEACLNSRPLAPLSCDDDGVEALTHWAALGISPGPCLLLSSHFSSSSLASMSASCLSLLAAMVCGILATLVKFTKWHHPSRNASIRDIVVLQECGLVPAQWPLGKVTQVYKGGDGWSES